MFSFDQNLVTLEFLREKNIIISFLQRLTRKMVFRERCFWFKFDNSRMGIGMTSKFCSNMAKGFPPE